jgi:hypothetical protein
MEKVRDTNTLFVVLKNLRNTLCLPQFIQTPKEAPKEIKPEIKSTPSTSSASSMGLNEATVATKATTATKATKENNSSAPNGTYSFLSRLSTAELRRRLEQLEAELQWTEDAIASRTAYWTSS